MLPVKSTDLDSMQCASDNEDKDLAEDQAALDWRQELTGDALPTVIQLENLENHYYFSVHQENITFQSIFC